MLYLKITAVHKEGKTVLLRKPLIQTIENLASLVGVPQESIFVVDIVRSRHGDNGNSVEEVLAHITV